MAIGLSGVVATVSVVSERRSIPRANRRLEWELDVDGVFNLSCWSARTDFEDVVSRSVDLTHAININFGGTIRV